MKQQQKPKNQNKEHKSHQNWHIISKLNTLYTLSKAKTTNPNNKY